MSIMGHINEEDHAMKRITLFLSALIFTSAAAAQQAYPSRPLRIVIPWPPGLLSAITC
jgi:tripartite-type tricarboxylate transporter receptor subunit TctC